MRVAHLLELKAELVPCLPGTGHMIFGRTIAAANNSASAGIT